MFQSFFKKSLNNLKNVNISMLQQSHSIKNESKNLKNITNLKSKFFKQFLFLISVNYFVLNFEIIQYLYKNFQKNLSVCKIIFINNSYIINLDMLVKILSFDQCCNSIDMH